MKNLLVVALILVAIVAPSLATDVYLLQAHSEGPPVFDPAADGREVIEWDTDAFFFNQGSTDAQVKLLDDNEGIEFTIQAQHSASLSGLLPPRRFNFVHASVPDSVVVENALFIGEVQTSTLNPTAPIYNYGKVRLPVFTSLTAANQPHVHLATFLGEQSSHANVSIYNGGLLTAMAHVEVRRQCDDAVIQDVMVAVGAKTSLVVPWLAADFRGCRVPTSMRSWSGNSIYTIVTVDQPSLSFVSSVANNQIPKAMVSVN